jgi:hypothetical protein
MTSIETTPLSLESPNAIVMLLRAEPPGLRAWVERWQPRQVAFCLAAIALGAGLYGATMGFWRSPLQALYTGLKFPLVILLTTLGNGLLNSMLAPLLGLNLSVRQALMVVLLSFASTSIILGALSPISAFVVWNAPPLSAATQLTSPGYGLLQLSHVVFIALAGVLANRSLLPLLQSWGGSRAAGRKVLLAWLGGNLLLGSQIAWVLRPFIWDPARPVEFLGPEYFRGSFYETVFQALLRLIAP